MNQTLWDRALRFMDVHEDAKGDHPLIQWWHSLCGLSQETPDEVAWCSSFINGMAWDLQLPRSRSAAARSWLTVGTQIMTLRDAVERANDIVILKRGTGPQPGPEVLKASGHVGVYGGLDLDNPNRIRVLGGNQGNRVSIASFPMADIIGLRRLVIE